MVFSFRIAYIIVSIIALLLILVLMFFIKEGKKRNLTIMNFIAFACVLVGMIFGTDRFFGYLLLGAGIVLAFIEVLIKLKK